MLGPKTHGIFILNINDKSIDGFRHPFIFELIYAIHNAEDYCKLKGLKELDMHGLRQVICMMLFWNKWKFLISISINPSRFGDKVEYLFWFSKTKERKFNIDPMRLKYDEKSVKRMQRPLLKRFVQKSGEACLFEYKQGGIKLGCPVGAERHWVHCHRCSLKKERCCMSDLWPRTSQRGRSSLVRKSNSFSRIEDAIEVVHPQVGDTPHPSTIVASSIGSETRRIAGNASSTLMVRCLSVSVW